MKKAVLDDFTPTTLESGNRIAGERGFQDKTLFISGATGFIGKVLIEKLLRTCPLVKKIYVLVRGKKNKNPDLRMKEIFDGPLYDLLRKEHGDDIFKKVVAIPGDVMEIGLGISQEHRELLGNEVQIIHHLAATVRFDEPITKAVLINTRGTKFMLDLARECKNLMVFNHVSTAYCHPNEKILYERTYPPPADPDTVIKAVALLGDKMDAIKDNIILGTYPNTYAFTKALAEDLVAREFDNLPVIILRPSVVIPIWKEPIPGWNDNINGPTGILIAAGKGVLRSMYCDSKGYADFLPVDVLVNVLMLSTFDFLKYRERRVYNCTSSFEFKVTWEDIIVLGRNLVTTRIPLNGVAWYPGGSLKTSRFMNNICVLFFHYLPAILLDPLIFLSGNRPVLWRVHRRITKGCELFEYYVNNQWQFSNEGSLKARSILTEDEKNIYKVDGQGMDVEEYFYNCIRAARLYVLNEPDNTIPSAKRHMRIMWAVDQIAHLIFYLGFTYLLYIHIINPIFGI